MKTTTVTHIIFDMDGTLMDTEQIYQKIIKMVVEQYGGVYTDKVKRAVMGRTETDVAKEACREAQLSCTPEQFVKEYERLYKIYLPDAELLPGAEKLIRHFDKHNIPMAIGTSSSLKSMEYKLLNHQKLFSLISHITSGSSDVEVKRGKPFPDVFLVCAQRFDPPAEPCKCLVFEDSPHGIEAARSAAMQSVFIPDFESLEAGDIKKCPSTITLRSLEEFKPELFGLPPF